MQGSTNFIIKDDRENTLKGLELLEPADGVITDPLQLYPWNGLIQEELEASYDRGLPRPVSFSWVKPSLNGRPLRYEVWVSSSPEFLDFIRIENLIEPQAELWNLYLGKRYFWKVTAREAHGRILARSPIWSFITHSAGPRWIRVPDITNFRDIGGWPLKAGGRVRQGLLYRSSELNSHLRLTPEGERILLEDLKIKTDIDLRGSEELREPALDECRVHWLNIPVQPYAYIVLPQYQKLYRYAFQVLANPAIYPAVVHCWGGADRTGTLVFLLEAVLGMEEQCLIQDYELTSLSIWGRRSSNSADFTSFLETLRNYALPGSSFQEQAEGYLRYIGVSEQEIDSIRCLFIEND